MCTAGRTLIYDAQTRGTGGEMSNGEQARICIDPVRYTALGIQSHIARQPRSIIVDCGGCKTV